ncbi:hypothetical protein MNEG_5596, partial [Monoraphidium neglectum]
MIAQAGAHDLQELPDAEQPTAAAPKRRAPPKAAPCNALRPPSAEEKVMAWCRAAVADAADDTQLAGDVGAATPYSTPHDKLSASAAGGAGGRGMGSKERAPDPALYQTDEFRI